MEPTTTGRFRLLDRRPDGTYLLVDLDEAIAAVEDDDPEADLQPIAVGPPEDADLVEAARELQPGYTINASVAWDGDEARLAEWSTTGRTRIQFADGVSGIFEAAQETWHDARMAGDAMNSRPTYSTDNEPNGVVYTFAKQRPPRDLFEEFRTGATPIEPLIQRVELEREDDHDRAVFVMNPVDEEFVLIYIVFRKDGMLAETVRDTYGLPST
ncbi:MAG: DUF6663 family protein [Halohasta sp.]